MAATFRKTKIVCTIGPSSLEFPVMKRLAQAGMDVVRLNMSHGTHDEKLQQIKNVRKIAEQLGKSMAVFADLQGPKLRLGIIDGVRVLKSGETISLSSEPDDNDIPMQFDLSPFVKPKHRLFLNDGLIKLKIVRVEGKRIITKALNGGGISSNKGVNVPDTNLGDAGFTKKDHDDAVFALDAGVDYIALSFVQTASDIEPLKRLIEKHNPKVKIIAKIEKKEAIKNLESIVKQASILMVARGDLAIETDNAQVPIYQEMIINLCRQYRKPVIVATQMLESMTENPRPTRAEVSDVANAVLDQVDGVMLSAESASGKYPVESVETMRNIILSVESHPAYHHSISISWDILKHEDISFWALASAAAAIGERINAKAIVAGTASGKTAKIISAFRPKGRIIAITHDEITRNQLSLVWGTEALVVKPTQNFDLFYEHVLEEITRGHNLQKGDKVVIMVGVAAGVSGTTNTIKIATI